MLSATTFLGDVRISAPVISWDEGAFSMIAGNKLRILRPQDQSQTRYKFSLYATQTCTRIRPSNLSLLASLTF